MRPGRFGGGTTGGCTMPFTGSRGGSSRGGGSFEGLAGVEALPGVLVCIVHYYFIECTYKKLVYTFQM